MIENKTNIFGIGISGLVGSRIVALLQDKYNFDNLSLDTGVNITDPSTLDVIRKDTDHSVVLHLAAIADVDGCEKDKHLGKDSLAYKVNVQGTENVVAACKATNKKIIYISTDFVFGGTKPEGEVYQEEDIPNPINWYAQTKYQGEEMVRNSGLSYLIVRLAYPYRNIFVLKKDFVRAIADRLKENQPVTAVTDHLMTPTFLDDIALGLDVLLQHNATGIFHLVGSQFVTPYDAAVLIAERFHVDKSLISKTTRAAFFKDRAPRPFNLALNNDKIKKLGAQMKTFEEGLALL